MSVVSRVALVALVCLLSLVGSSVAQTAGTYSFCYQLLGLPHETLDDPYSISVNVTGTYNTTLGLQTSTNTSSYPTGEYYTLLTATGLRQILTRNNFVQRYPITALLPPKSDFSDNRFYITNYTFPQFVDADGLTFNLSRTGLFPGKTMSSFWNVYRSHVYGAVLEDMTSGLDLTKFSFSAKVIGWNGTQYNGVCNPLPLEVTIIPPTAPLNGTYNITLTYSLVNEVSEPSFTVTVNAYFIAYKFPKADDFNDFYYMLNSTAGGHRTYCYLGSCITSTINGSAPVGLYGFTDNRIYNYAPYLDYEGIGYTFTPAQPKPGAPMGVNLTNSVNPYVSKAGSFFEGYGSYSSATNLTKTYGTNPGGFANATLSALNFHVSITGPK